MGERVCAVCASSLPGGRTVVCSPECRRRRHVSSAAYQRAHIKYKASERWKATRVAYWEQRKSERTCAQCGQTWRAKRPEARFCSPACRGLAHRKQSHSALVLHPDPNPLSWLPPRHPALRPASKPTAIRFVAGPCARCSTPFVIASQLTSRYCSDRCLKRDHNSLRRAQKRDAFVEPVSRARIFERDDWRCQICKKKVRRNAVVPHPKAPVLDHITPLADGGTHEPANVQCAHFLCNSIKSHGAANDQLRLIG